MRQLAVVQALVERLARAAVLDRGLVTDLAAIVQRAYGEPGAAFARIRWRALEAQTPGFVESPSDVVVTLGRESALGSLTIATGSPAVPNPAERIFVQTIADLLSAGFTRTGALDDLREREARLELLDALTEVSRSAADSDALLRATLEMLGKRLGAARCAFADVDANGDRSFVIRDWSSGCASIVGEHRISDLGPELARAIRHGGSPVVVTNVAEPIRARTVDAFGTASLASFVSCTLLREGSPRAIFLVQSIEPRLWSASEVSLVEVVAERCWAAIEQRATEAKLRQSEGQLRHAGAAAKVGAWSFELAEKRVLWSEELYAIHELPLGSPPSADGALISCAPEFLVQAQKAIGACIRDGTPIDLEVQILTATGSRKWIHAVGSAEHDPSTGKVVRLHGAMQDIDERRRLEDELQRAQRMEAVGRLAGGIAHDFNNLLAAILGYTSLVLDRLPPDDAMRADMLEVQRAGERASDLTKQLLTFSRHRATERRRLDARAVVAALEPMLRRLVGEGVTLVVRPSEAVGALLADRAQLEQVLVNLVVNARDASAAGSTIEIGVTEVDGAAMTTPLGVGGSRFVRFTVQDEGHGMDAATRARMFEPFFTTKPGKGTGLGLATVYGIVEQSDGHILVGSEPGVGTTFDVLFPTVDGAFDVEPARHATMAPLLRGSETILLVEDSDQVRAVVTEALRRDGYDVLVAKDGAEGLAICEARKGRIDLLLTDVLMPGIDGWELGARVRALRPETCILHMSSFAPDGADRNEKSERGDFIAKPFTAGALLRKLRELLEREPKAPSVQPARRVLYVDDEDALGVLVKRALGRRGHAVTTFVDAHEALAAFTSAPESFDVLVTDVRMPKMSGFDLAREMRRIRPGLQIVLTSGVFSPEDVTAAESVGLGSLVTKSHTIEELAERLDRAVRARK